MKELYQEILEAINFLLLYYSELFGFAAEKKAVEFITQPIGKHEITFIVVTIPKRNNCIYAVHEIQHIMQEFLEKNILPASTIRPYKAGKELMEPLYINKITDTGTSYLLNIVYIDNMTAFRYVKNAKKFF